MKYQNLAKYYTEQDILQKQAEVDVLIELKFKSTYQELPKIYVVIKFLDLYCQIEQNSRPYLKNIPFIIINGQQVMASNSEARKHNIRPGDSVINAQQKCKYLKIINGDDGNYYDICKKLDEILRCFDPNYQVLGLDSALLEIPIKQIPPTKSQVQVQQQLSQSTVIQNSAGHIFWNIDNVTEIERYALLIAEKLKKRLENEIGFSIIGISFTPQIAALCAKLSNSKSVITKLSFTSHREIQHYVRTCIDPINIKEILFDIVQEPQNGYILNNQLQSLSLLQFMGVCEALQIQKIADIYNKRGTLSLLEQRFSKHIIEASCGLLVSQRVMHDMQFQIQGEISLPSIVYQQKEHLCIRQQLLRFCKDLCAKLQQQQTLCTQLGIQMMQQDNKIWKADLPVKPYTDQLQDLFAIVETLVMMAHRSPPYQIIIIAQTTNNIPSIDVIYQGQNTNMRQYYQQQQGPLAKYLINNQNNGSRQVYIGSTNQNQTIQLPDVPFGVPTIGVDFSNDTDDLTFNDTNCIVIKMTDQDINNRQSEQHNFKQIYGNKKTQEKQNKILTSKSQQKVQIGKVSKQKNINKKNQSVIQINPQQNLTQRKIGTIDSFLNSAKY